MLPCEKPEVSFVVITHNEERQVAQVLEGIRSNVGRLTYEIVVVDAGSSDNTRSVAAEAGADKVLGLRVRSKDLAFGQLFLQAAKLVEGAIICLVDPTTFVPAMIPRLIRPILAGREEVIYASYGAARKRKLEDPAEAYKRVVRDRDRTAKNVQALLPHYYSVNKLKEFVEPLPRLPKDLKTSRAKSFAHKLIECPKGKRFWKQYQSLCRDLLTFLLVPPLLTPIQESKTIGGHQRRDLIFHIPYGLEQHFFWDHLRDKFAETALIVDAKNSVRPITQREVTMISKYLSAKGLGRFGVILTRSPPSKSALEEQRRIWRNEGKMVSTLTDYDLMLMLYVKERGGEPELVIDYIMRTFLMEFH